MSDKKTVVIYHANCADGFCCAWLLSKVYPDAEFVNATTLMSEIGEQLALAKRRGGGGHKQAAGFEERATA